MLGSRTSQSGSMLNTILKCCVFYMSVYVCMVSHIITKIFCLGFDSFDVFVVCNFVHAVPFFGSLLFCTIVAFQVLVTFPVLLGLSLISRWIFPSMNKNTTTVVLVRLRQHVWDGQVFSSLFYFWLSVLFLSGHFGTKEFHFAASFLAVSACDRFSGIQWDSLWFRVSVHHVLQEYKKVTSATRIQSSWKRWRVPLDYADLEWVPLVWSPKNSGIHK